MSQTTATTLPDGTITVDVRVECAHDEMVPIEKIIPNPRNPNTHPRNQIEMLAKIIAAQGWRAPIAVSKRSGFVVRGHGRLEAAKLLGVPTVPVDFQDYTNEAEEWADLIADNRIAELAEMDYRGLSEILNDLSHNSPDILALTGYSEMDLHQIMQNIKQPDAPEDFKEVDENIETDKTCPKCGYKWSGGE